MGKIKIEEIRKAAIEHDWTLVSDKYKNLKTPLEFICGEGHQVYLPYERVRDKWECPICQKNQYYNFNEQLPHKRADVQRTLALDQATHITGYAIFDGADLIYAGTFEATAEDEIERDIQIRNWLDNFLYSNSIDIVGIEGIQLQQFNNKTIGVTTYQTLARLQGILMATCCDRRIEYYVCPPATWRAHCGVKGRSRIDKKRSMQMKIKEWFDITVSDDVADAIGIGMYIKDNYKKTVETFDWE